MGECGEGDDYGYEKVEGRFVYKIHLNILIILINA